MNASIIPYRISRRAVLKGGALTVGFASAGIPSLALSQSATLEPRSLDPKNVDSFLSVNSDGTVTVFCGKVDLGQGLRIAICQIAGEELGIGVDKIQYVEGDTALTPDQGRTSGSSGIQGGGVQIRQAAATAREALIGLAAERLNMNSDDLVANGGRVSPKGGGTGVRFAELIGGRNFNLKLNLRAPLKDPATYTLVGKPLRRPDVPAKCTGSLTYVQDFNLPGMLHARVIRPPAIGAKLISVDESSITDFAGAHVVRIKDFLAVVADDEWAAVRAARAVRAKWSEWAGLPAQDKLVATLRADSDITDEVLLTRGVPDAEVRKAQRHFPPPTFGQCRAMAQLALLAQSPMCVRTRPLCGPLHRARMVIAKRLLVFSICRWKRCG
jgi:nicotinate dehydrogenase subunit B